MKSNEMYEIFKKDENLHEMAVRKMALNYGEQIFVIPQENGTVNCSRQTSTTRVHPNSVCDVLVISSYKEPKTDEDIDEVDVIADVEKEIDDFIEMVERHEIEEK